MVGISSMVGKCPNSMWTQELFKWTHQVVKVDSLRPPASDTENGCRVRGVQSRSVHAGLAIDLEMSCAPVWRKYPQMSPPFSVSVVFAPLVSIHG